MSTRRNRNKRFNKNLEKQKHIVDSDEDSPISDDANTISPNTDKNSKIDLQKNIIKFSDQKIIYGLAKNNTINFKTTLKFNITTLHKLTPNFQDFIIKLIPDIQYYENNLRSIEPFDVYIPVPFFMNGIDKHGLPIFHYDNYDVVYIGYIGVLQGKHTFKYGVTCRAKCRLLSEHIKNFDNFTILHVEKCFNTYVAEDLFEKKLMSLEMHQKINIKGHTFTELFTFNDKPINLDEIIKELHTVVVEANNQYFIDKQQNLDQIKLDLSNNEIKKIELFARYQDQPGFVALYNASQNSQLQQEIDILKEKLQTKDEIIAVLINENNKLKSENNPEWTPEKDAQVTEHFNAGIPLTEINTLIGGRSVKKLRTRIKKLKLNNIQNKEIVASMELKKKELALDDISIGRQ